MSELHIPSGEQREPLQFPEDYREFFAEIYDYMVMEGRDVSRYDEAVGIAQTLNRTHPTFGWGIVHAETLDELRVGPAAFDEKVDMPYRFGLTNMAVEGQVLGFQPFFSKGKQAVVALIVANKLAGIRSPQTVDMQIVADTIWAIPLTAKHEVLFTNPFRLN